MNWYIDVLKKYAVFSGRACRREYWFFVLFNFIIGLILGLLTLIPVAGNILWIFSFAYSLGIIVPAIAVTIRRLHDTGRSGLSLFFIFIPLVGIIILIVFMAKDGTSGENQYGQNIKFVEINDLTEEIEKKTGKRWRIPLIIISSLFILVIYYYFGFKSINSSREMFGIFNISNNNYYLNVSTDKGISQFSFKRYEQINDVKYSYICKTGKYKLNGARTIFQCERNDDVGIYLKLRGIFDELEIVDENNNIILDLNNDKNMEKILRIDGFFNTVFWNLRIE
jgi:uncharacterized membrane protein YhaH (DUF805 family)